MIALERAVRSYASLAPADSLVSVLRKTQNMDAKFRASMVKAISEGWNYRLKGIALKPTDKVFMASYAKANGSDRLQRVLTAWGENTNAPMAADVKRIRIRTIKEAMKFDLKEFSVKPGQQVEITLENPDAMQHNLVITKPGAMEKVGRAGDAMMKDEKGADKNYVPSIPEVLFSTPLVNPGQSFKLSFKAPATAGDYPFVCTFPGHWSIMNGVMRVR